MPDNDPLGILTAQNNTIVADDSSDPLGILKKKSGSNIIITPSSIGSNNSSQNNGFVQTINNYNQQHAGDEPNTSNLGFDIGTAPKGYTSSNLLANQKAQENELNKAAENTFKKTIGKGSYTKEDSIRVINQLKEGVKNGDLGITQDAEGNDVIKNSGNFFQSFKAAADQAYAQDIENKYLRGLNKNEAINYLNRIQRHPETAIAKENDIAPNGLGEAIGSQAGLIGKTIIGGMLGTETGLTGGASTGGFVSIAKDLANAGYSQALKKNYNILKNQGLSDNDAFDKATHAALVGEAVNLGTGALLSGEINLLPKPKITTEGFINSLKHTVATAPKVVGSAGVGAVLNDVATNAIANGNPIDAKQMWQDAKDAMEPMLIMHGSLGALSAIVNGQKTIVPSAARPQLENIAASADRNEVNNYLSNQETNGAIPEGTTKKVLDKLQEFDEQKQTVNNLPITEEQKASVTGKLLQRKDITEETKELKKYGTAFENQIAQNEEKINNLDDDVSKIISTKQPYKFEYDEAGERLQDAGGRPNVSRETNENEVEQTPTVNKPEQQQAETNKQQQENVGEDVQGEQNKLADNNTDFFWYW